jgi:hypothetical protein
LSEPVRLRLKPEDEGVGEETLLSAFCMVGAGVVLLGVVGGGGGRWEGQRGESFRLCDGAVIGGRACVELFM